MVYFNSQENSIDTIYERNIFSDPIEEDIIG